MKSQCKQCNSDFWRQNGRKRWKFECLQACRLSEPIVCTSNMMFLTSHRIQNTSNEAWKQAKSKKKAKICWFSGFAPVTTRKNRKVQLSRRGSNIWQNPFNSIFVNLNANLNETSKSKRGLGEENFDFLCFFGPHRSRKRSTGRKKKYKNTSWAKTAATEGKKILGS